MATFFDKMTHGYQIKYRFFSSRNEHFQSNKLSLIIKKGEDYAFLHIFVSRVELKGSVIRINLGAVVGYQNFIPSFKVKEDVDGMDSVSFEKIVFFSLRSAIDS